MLGVICRDALDVLRAYNLDVVAVVIAQDGKRIAPPARPASQCPTALCPAAHLLAVAVFGVIGVNGARFTDVGIEDVVCNADHYVEHRAAVHIVWS